MLTIIRYLVFMLLWICGVHFWIFPNLYADVGFIDSFKPFLTTEYSFENKIVAYIGRLAIILTYSYAVWYYFTNYDDVLNLKQGYDAGMADVYDWGEATLAMKPREPGLEQFRHTKGWYDTMMDEWVKEDPPTSKDS